MNLKNFTGKKHGNGSKYFTTKKKGEIYDWKTNLNSLNKDKVKEAVKKVIAAMTLGKDVSSLFTDVIKSMQTDNIELKKLVYLYIINHARSHPDKAILVVNTFRKDATAKTSPLIRALAIRTMGCIRVNRITEYLLEPLGAALVDEDPYVKKTAAICVAKLYDINAEAVEEQGFIDELRKMISDSNPMVVANAVAALAEISDASGKDMFNMNKSMLNKLQAALNEASEWGQIFILDCLAKYEPDEKDAKEIVDRVSPRLKHANSAVAMSAVRVIMKYLRYLNDDEYKNKLLTSRLPPPLITLLSEHKPEIQYVALRNINLIVQKVPNCLTKAVRHFFCKYNDPIYVKMEKLEIMIKLANLNNIDKILLEFRQYAREVDIDFVRKSVLAIGRCAIKLEKAAQRCIKVLLELIETGINYVVQEAVIVVKDIFRKYPNSYELILATLCKNLESLNEPEAKASMIWIIGEYCDYIDNAPELLEDNFIDTFEEEPALVQLQLLTAVVKLFLKRPDEAKDMVTQVLNMATDNSDNPDLRDRGYVYWRLLSTDPAAAQKVILAQRPNINDDDYNLDQNILDELINHISTLASIYHKPPEYFIKDSKSVTLRNKTQVTDSDESSDETSDSQYDSDDEYDDDDDDDSNISATEDGNEQASNDNVIDILGFNTMTTTSSSNEYINDPIVCNNKGIEIKAATERINNKAYIRFTLTNNTSQNLNQFAIKFNDKCNWLNIIPEAIIFKMKLIPGETKTHKVAIKQQANHNLLSQGKENIIQTAIKTEVGVLLMQFDLPIHIFFQANATIDKKTYSNLWQSINKDNEVRLSINKTYTVDQISSKLTQNNIIVMAHRYLESRGDVIYSSIKYKNQAILVELCSNNNQIDICVRSQDSHISKNIATGIVYLLD